MHQVHLELTDQLYNQAKRRAVEGGYKTVDEFIAEFVSDELTEEQFCADLNKAGGRLKEIADKAGKDYGAGKTRKFP